MTIEELLKSMISINDTNLDKNLPNTRETWERIGSLDSFSELGFSSDTEKEEFLKDWINNNPYSSI